MKQHSKKVYRLIPMIFCAVLLVSLFITDLMSSYTGYAAESGDYVIDDQGYLTDSEYNHLSSVLASVSNSHGVDVVVYLDDSLYGKTPQQLADDTYDYGGYRSDGILFMVNFEDNDWAISTKGYGITAFTDAGQDYMISQIRPYLSNGNYSQAIETYAELADDFLTQAENGQPYGTGNLPKKPFRFFRSLLIALGGGFIISWLRASSLKSQTKTVHKAVKADSYLVGNVVLNQSQEIFNHSEFRMAPQVSSGGGGGSTTHVSSSGAVHGGSSGKF
ncbi:MAG: TPM domain-containing protein [Lachnospiraceae bacterium]|nr:TPM domain-containing protein [Lachnospiraceae bacterium]MBR1567695.1 TPM domain-containing protein [Lachnospiraceae bacterium]